MVKIIMLMSDDYCASLYFSLSQYLKKNGGVNLLQFCLAVEDFNKKMMVSLILCFTFVWLSQFATYHATTNYNIMMILCIPGFDYLRKLNVYEENHNFSSGGRQNDNVIKPSSGGRPTR